MPVLDIKNPTLVRGHARLEGREDGRFRVRVGDYVIAADQVVVNTGTRSVIPAIDGLKEIKFIHAGLPWREPPTGNWLEWAARPEHLAMIALVPSDLRWRSSIAEWEVA